MNECVQLTVYAPALHNHRGRGSIGASCLPSVQIRAPEVLPETKVEHKRTQRFGLALASCKNLCPTTSAKLTLLDMTQMTSESEPLGLTSIPAQPYDCVAIGDLDYTANQAAMSWRRRLRHAGI